MVLGKLFENLALSIDAFATCGVSRGWRLSVPGLDWVVLHFVMRGDGAIRCPKGNIHPFPCYSLAVVPTHLEHDLECGHEVSHSAKVGEGEPSNTPVPLYRAGTDMDFFVACGRFRATYGAGVDLFGQLRDVIVVDCSQVPQMRTTFEAVLDQPAKPFSLEGLAEMAGMSRSVFAKRFHDGFGRTPMDYVREVRLRSGARLLDQPELSVDAIASRVGFASRSHFSKAFSDQFGCSPSEFRTRDVSAME